VNNPFRIDDLGDSGNNQEGIEVVVTALAQDE
jgi:hypothetical protein